MPPDVASVTCRDVDLEGYHVQLREIVADDGVPSRTTTLVVLFGFVNQSPKVINRFCNIYHELGFNVMFVPGYVFYGFCPRYVIKVAELLLYYLKTRMSHYPNLLFHAISIGCNIVYVIIEMMRSEETKYAEIGGRIRGVIYDSIIVGTISHIAIGAGITLSDNRLIQRVLAISMFIYLNIMTLLDRKTAAMFLRSRRNSKLRPLSVPTLLFHCLTDPMSSTEMLNELVGKWQETLSDAFEKRIWQDSKHAEHLRVHTDEYLQTLHKFVKNIPELAAGIITRSNL